MQSVRGAGNGLMRSRWAAIGAAVAVSVGAGGLFVASAADSEPAVFVAVTPVRVVDTRVALGLPAALVSTDGELVQITGSIDTIDGEATVVPAGATALVANVTAVLPTAGGFLSVRPGDAAGDPSTSSLNFLAGKTTPNAVTVQLSAAGDIAVYYRASGGDTGDTTHFLVDVVGYYVEGAAGAQGPEGPQGQQGPEGPEGPAGQDATVSAAQFYALMPPDNAATVAAGSDVQFPNNGPIAGTGTVVRVSDSAFTLLDAGVYRLTFQVPVTEAGQLAVTRNGSMIDYTVVGRATGTTPISTTVLIDASSGDVITIRNVGPNALTITPLAGGTEDSAATLLIEYIGPSVFIN